MENKTERRNDTYTFTSERGLIDFFSATMPKAEIKKVLDAFKNDFCHRTSNNKTEDRLQLLKKCEAELMRINRRKMGIGEENQI
jgi:hypothetical protein